MTAEEKLSIKLEYNARRCPKDSIGERIYVATSCLISGIGMFNHAMAHAFGYETTSYNRLKG
jgi:hypothetical protein